MSAAATTVGVDRKLIERLLVDIDAVASLEIHLHARHATVVSERLDVICTELEEALRLSDKKRAELHDEAWKRGQELFQKWSADQVRGAS